MTAVDSSVFVAMVLEEPERPLFFTYVFSRTGLLISSVSVVETRMVLQSRVGPTAVADFNDLLALLDIEVVAPSAADLPIIHDAFLRYGKGSGSAARLNMVDLFSYALAKGRGVPLLCKGDDFGHTDLRPALPAPG